MAIVMHLQRSIWWYYAASVHIVHQSAHKTKPYGLHSKLKFTWTFFAIFFVDVFTIAVESTHIQMEFEILFKILEVSQQSTKALQLRTERHLHMLCMFVHHGDVHSSQHKRVQSKQSIR